MNNKRPSTTETPPTEHLHREGSKKNLAGTYASDVTAATFLDVAVLRCLFITQWQEEGIYWALHYMYNRLVPKVKNLSYTYRYNPFNEILGYVILMRKQLRNSNLDAEAILYRYQKLKYQFIKVRKIGSKKTRTSWRCRNLKMYPYWLVK